MCDAIEAGQQLDAVIIAADDALRESLVLLLTAEGMRLGSAANVAGLLAFQASTPKLLIIDWLILKQAQADLAHAIAKSGWAETAIVMMEDEQTVVTFPGRGNRHYVFLTKPFRADDILKLIAEMRSPCFEPALRERPVEPSLPVDGKRSQAREAL